MVNNSLSHCQDGTFFKGNSLKENNTIYLERNRVYYFLNLNEFNYL